MVNLTPEAVRAWHATTLVDRPTARSHAYGLLHAAMATAVTDGLIGANPCHIPKASVAKHTRQPVILTVEEVGQLAELVEDRFRALILVSAWCGLRWGEITELRRKDVRRRREALYVGRGVTHRGQCRIDTPKSGKARIVMIPPHIRADIKHHLDSFVGR